MHVPGYGDALMADLTVMPDPCPILSASKKRSLGDRDRIIWAPMTDGA